MGNARRPSFKGCCAMCAAGKGRVKGQGHAERITNPERRVIGRSRRVSRGEVPVDQLPGISGDDDLVWFPRVDYRGRAVLWTDYEFAEPVAAEFVSSNEHVPVNAAPTHDSEGWRLFGPIAEVCLACSDFDAGRLVPVSFCPRALSVLDAESTAEDAELRRVAGELGFRV